MHRRLYKTIGAVAVATALFGAPAASAQDGTMFVESAVQAGIQGIENGLEYGAAWGDFTGNGFDDLFIAAHPANLLYVNNGDGTFTEVAEAAGVQDLEMRASGAAWGDFDGDGLLDLYVCNLSSAHDEAPVNRLFRNNGDGTFTDVAEAAGVTGLEWLHDDHDHDHEHDHNHAHGVGLLHDHDHDHEDDALGGSVSAAWGDFDNDGRLDLIVSNRNAGALLYRNLGDGTFELVSKKAGLPIGLDHHDHDHDQDHDHGHHQIRHGHIQDDSFVRLMVSDWENGLVHVIDPIEGDIVASFETSITSGFYVYASSNQLYGYVVQPGGNVVNVIFSGIFEEDHGDHMHPYADDPIQLSFKMEGERPIHFVSHHDQAVVFFDGEGVAGMIDERRLPSPSVLRFASPKPHHGVGVPMGDRIIVSTLDEEDTSPQGVDIFDLEGNLVQSFPTESPGLHGEAVLGNMVAFGATDGVFIVERVDDEFVSHKVLNPADAPTGRVGTVIAHEDLPYFVGNFGRGYLSHIDVDTMTMKLIELPSPYSAFALDAEGEHIVTISEDGRVHVYDAWDGDYEGSVQVMDPFSVDVPRGTPMPSIAAAWHHTVFVSEPSTGHIYEVDVEDLVVKRTMHLGGAPTNMIVLGLIHYIDHDHDHDHDHDIIVGVEHAAWADYNEDGYLDLFLSVAVVGHHDHDHDHHHHHSVRSGLFHDHGHDGEKVLTRNYLFRNNGDGTFTDVTEEAGLYDPNYAATHSAVWGDYNNNGLMDLFVCNLGSVNRDTAVPSKLYRNNGDGTFTDVTEEAGIAEHFYLFNAAWADLNNDGWLDLVAIQHPSHDDYEAGEFYEVPHPIYLNNGDGTFTNINAEPVDAILDTGVTDINHLIGVAVADYDGDGGMDILMTENHADGPLLLYRNQHAALLGNWLKIDLRQEGSNPFAVGAQIALHTDIVSQVRSVGAVSTGFGSQSSMTQHFGIGDEEIARVIVTWPDGVWEDYGLVAAGESYTLIRGAGEETTVAEWLLY